MTSAEPRWRQRLENLQHAPGQLQAALNALAADPENEVIGMLLSHGGIDVSLPREVLRQAFAAGLLEDGQLWIDMLEQRNLMALTYDVSRSRLARALIRERFAPALLALAGDLEQRP